MTPLPDATDLVSQSVSDLASDPSSLLETVRSSRDPVVLTQQGQGVAVVVDIESYRDLVDEIALLRDVQRGLADVAEGRVFPHEDVKAFLHERYGR